MKDHTFILDPAHGEDTPGKRSPDGLHMEYLWSREICQAAMKLGITEGLDIKILVSETKEIGLTSRVMRYNNCPSKNKVVVSIHNNAAGKGGWMSARGFEIWTTKGQTQSDKIADIFYIEFEKKFPEIKMRKDTSDGDFDKEENFTVLTGKGYSAVLLEILFQDNQEDVELLMKSAFKQKIVRYLVDSMKLINQKL